MATQTVTLTLSKTQDQGQDLFTTNYSPVSFDRVHPNSLSKKNVDGVKGAFTIEGVLTPNECKQLVEFTTNIGYQDAPITTFGGPKMMKDVRDNKRILYTAPDDFLSVIYDRIKGIMEREMTSSELFDDKTLTIGSKDYLEKQKSLFEVEGLNERLRFYSYEPHQRFQPHFDGSFDTKTRFSLFTFIIYLNDGFEGGHTTFFPRNADPVKVSPKAGTALIFPHGRSPFSPLHEGSPCDNGNKYALRSDVMFKLKPKK